MNCKPGDLALILRGKKTAGTMVTCVRLEDPQVMGGLVASKFRGTTWLVDKDIAWVNSTRTKKELSPHVPDEWLMPIRPDADPIVVDEPKEVEA